MRDYEYIHTRDDGSTTLTPQWRAACDLVVLRSVTLRGCKKIHDELALVDTFRVALGLDDKAPPERDEVARYLLSRWHLGQVIVARVADFYLAVARAGRGDDDPKVAQVLRMLTELDRPNAVGRGSN